MDNLKEIIRVLSNNKNILRERYKVKKIGLFGSCVKGKLKKRSDIDIVVEFDINAFGENFKGLYDTFLNLHTYLEHLLNRKVDILTPISIETIRIKEVAEDIKRNIIYV
ncbi:MAG: nucleotidyltransferase domain-containing protein [candidate division WOR-3 bacterium]